jgi:NAD-dependent dihydropyrimidine dehydrogenase PreA subunit
VKDIITHYGYSDGSGEYYIVIDSDKCSGCGKCVQKCPQAALKLETEFIDLEDKTVAAVNEDQRKKIKYTCASCKPENNNTPCVLECQAKAIRCSWNQK